MKKSITFLLTAILVILPLFATAGAEGESAAGGPGAPATAFEGRSASHLSDSEPSVFGVGGFPGAILRIVFSLAIVFGVLYAFLWVLRRMRSDSSMVSANETIRVVGCIYLNQKNVIHFVRLLDELLVIGTNSGAMSLLTEIKDERRIAQIENALEGSRSPACGLFLSGFFDRSLLRFQKELEKDTLGLDDQIRTLDDQISRLKKLSIKKQSGKD